MSPSLETYVRASPNRLHTRVSYEKNKKFYSLTTLTRNSVLSRIRNSVRPLTSTLLDWSLSSLLVYFTSLVDKCQVAEAH